MRKIILLLPFFLFLSFAILTFWIFKNSQPVNLSGNYIDFSVKLGSSAAQIGFDLKQKELIRSSVLFKIYVQLSGLSNNIQAGDYRLSSSLNLFQIVDQLAKKPLEIKVTIPEGFNRKEIAAKFAKSLGQDQSFINQFLAESENDEGYLFPDTYLVSNTATPGAIIAKMRLNFDLRIGNLKPTREQIVLASIIEKEAKSVEERPIVAGILNNRLKVGMPLQVDVAPVTYEKKGLPNVPIANPGLVSIKAAIAPSETDFWYYLHDSSGIIHYARTLEEQNRNIDEFLR